MRSSQWFGTTLTKLMLVAVVTAIVAGFGAGMVKTFDGQQLPRKEAAKLFLKDKVGRRDLDSIMYCFVTSIDGVNLADKYDLEESRPEYFVREHGMSYDQAERIDRLFREFDAALRFRSFSLTPGLHTLEFKMAARSTSKASSDLVFSLGSITLNLQAEADHEYRPRATFSRERWTTAIEDKTTNKIVASSQPDVEASGE